MKFVERNALAYTRQIHRPDVVQRDIREQRMNPQRQRAILRG
jgi:hypothetical protein